MRKWGYSEGDNGHWNYSDGDNGSGNKGDCENGHWQYSAIESVPSAPASGKWG
jgi:hypothetical protein